MRITSFSIDLPTDWYGQESPVPDHMRPALELRNGLLELFDTMAMGVLRMTEGTDDHAPSSG